MSKLTLDGSFVENLPKFIHRVTISQGCDKWEGVVGFNGHVGIDKGGFGEVHGGFGIGEINDGGIRLLDWAVGKELCLMNTFQKRKIWLNDWLHSCK